MSTTNGDKPWWVPAHATTWTPNQKGTTVVPTSGTLINGTSGVYIQGPSLMSMAGNLASTALSAIQHAAQTGILFASDEKVEERLKICEACEFLDKSIYRCLRCGCMMKFKAKTEVAKCPINKW